jgi:ABC-type transporter Mla subunit MlaD
MNKNLKAGIIILSCILLAIICFFGPKIYTFYFNYYRIIMELETGINVAAGDKVSISGVKVGEIEAVEPKGSKVAATIKIKKEIKIPIESNFIIENIGLFGEKNVSIYLSGNKEYYEPNSIVKAQSTVAKPLDIAKTIRSLISTAQSEEINKKLDSIITLLNQNNSKNKQY